MRKCNPVHFKRMALCKDYREFLKLSKIVVLCITENPAKGSRFEEQMFDPKHFAAYKQSSALTRGKDVKNTTEESISCSLKAKDCGELGVLVTVSKERDSFLLAFETFSIYSKLPEMCVD